MQNYDVSNYKLYNVYMGTLEYKESEEPFSRKTLFM